MAHTMARWEPFTELAEMRSRFERLFGDLADGEERTWMPAVDVVREDGALVVRANVPGFKPDEIDITVDNGVLVISGQHEEAKERTGAFKRSIPLPDGVDPNAIEAKTREGVLEVRVGRLAEHVADA